MQFESLETRRLMSASLVQLTADRLKIQSDLASATATIAVANAVVDVDGAALTADGILSDTTLMPLFTQLHTDRNAMRTQLQLACANEASVVSVDQGVLVSEMNLVIADAGNPTAVAADQAQVLATQIQIQEDEITGLTNRLDIRESTYATKIFTDLNMIGVAVHNDTNISVDLSAAVVKFLDDRTSALHDFTVGLTTVIADHTTLLNDLEA
jgi:hypothetical protein